LNKAVTTNGLVDITKPELFEQINFSIHDNFEDIRSSIEKISKSVKVGINFVCRKDYVERYRGTIIKFLQRHKDIELLLLTYKPVIGDYNQMIPPDEVYKMGKELADTGLSIAVDGMTCRMCLGNEEFCDIGSDGIVYPCSFVRISMGNITKQSFKEIWSKRPDELTCPFGDM